MRKLNLQRAFPGLGAATKDFQDQAGAVEDLGAPGFLEIALLDRRQRAIHHHEFDLLSGNEPHDLLAVALAETRRGPALSDRRDERLRDRQIDCTPTPGGFVKPRLGTTRDMMIRL